MVQQAELSKGAPCKFRKRLIASDIGEPARAAAARIGRSPVTGETIKSEAKATVKFRLTKAAKDAVIPSKA